MSDFTDKLREFFHLSVPAVVNEGAVVVPSFVIPIEGEPLHGTIEVEVVPQSTEAVVKVALKKKSVKKKVVKKLPKLAKKKVKR